MGIYSSNMGNALGAIQAGINAANERAKAQGDYYRSLGQIWGKVPGEIASYVGKGYDAYQAQQESPEARLQALEAERNEAIYNQQVAQRQRVGEYLMSGRTNPAYYDGRGFSVAQDATNSMDGYKPALDMDDYAQYLRNSMGGVYRR